MISLRNRSLAGLLVFLLAAVALSGCAGSGDAAEQSSEPVVASPPSPTTPTITNEDEQLQGVSDPKRHYHHYWGEGPTEREEVVIFEAGLDLQQDDPFRGNEFACNTNSYREFDLETDGNDAEPETPPVNPDTQRADSVFAGTGHLRVELLAQSLSENDNTKLFLHYKPANLNYYLPETTCGIPLAVGQPIQIPVGPGQSDPPHQWAVSRWSFLVFAATDLNGNHLPSAATGTFDLKMVAVNGGDRNLDPAHPNLWGDGLTYDLGCVEATNVANQVVVWAPGNPAVHQPPKPPLSEIKLEYGRIVPLLTERVTVTVEYTYSGPVSGTTVELWYYGADTNRYAPATPLSEGEYEILDPQHLKADPPYEDESLWRFMLLPRSPAPDGPNGEHLSQFEGSFKICGTAHRDPGEVLT